MPKYVSSAKVREVYDINRETLRGWALKGCINARAITNVSGRKTWMYDLESIGSRMEQNVDVNALSGNGDKQKLTVVYCRVSSKKQLSDLERQQVLLSSAYPDSEIITDIGSGLNYNKQGITRLVEMVCREQIARIVVTFKDRLLRFGFELFAKMCKEHNVQIVIHSEQCDEKQGVEDFETQELQEDLLSVVNVFVARRNGKKAGVLRRLRKEQETTAQQFEQDQTTTNAENADETKQTV
jgi:predicted site-specific integrase-resolvase